MRWWIAVFVCLPALAQQSSRSANYTYDVNGHRVEGLRSRAYDGSGAQSMRNYNGREAPVEKVEERVVSQGPDGKIVERTIRPFDTDGRPMPSRKIRIEERRNPDGTATITTSEYHGDLNGRMQLWERAVASVRKSDDVERTGTVVERPTLNGDLEVVEKRERTARKAQEESITYRKDENGRFVPSEKEMRERTELRGEVVESTVHYARGTSGLELAEQQVSRTRGGTDGSQMREVDVFRPAQPGRINETGKPQLRERQRYETRPGAGNTSVETLSVSRPLLSDPKRFSAFEKVGERVCSGDCAPQPAATQR